ncbi:MAG: ion transporter, partial [Rhodoferax sp.]|nr:ion transporter [Rhodoferax sp.]
MSSNKANVLGKPLLGWRLQLYTIIFEADTRAGRWFDQALIAVILTSVAVVMTDSVQTVRQDYHLALTVAEWFFTLVFTLEYAAR